MEHHVLYVEDDPADAEAARQAITEVKAPIALHVVGDAARAFAFLGQRPPFRGVPPPDMILLDVGLPAMDGLAFLAELQRDPIWSRIPVVVFTSSRATAERELAWRRGAWFVTKPATWAGYRAFAERLRDWLDGRAATAGEA